MFDSIVRFVLGFSCLCLALIQAGRFSWSIIGFTRGKDADVKKVLGYFIAAVLCCVLGSRYLGSSILEIPWAYMLATGCAILLSVGLLMGIAHARENAVKGKGVVEDGW